MATSSSAPPQRQGTLLEPQEFAVHHSQYSEIANASLPCHDYRENAMVSLRRSYASATDENKHALNMPQVSASTVQLLEKALEQGLGFTVHGAGLKDILGNTVKSASFFLQSPRSESVHSHRKSPNSKSIVEAHEKDRVYNRNVDENINVHGNGEAGPINTVKLLDQNEALQSDIHIQKGSSISEPSRYVTIQEIENPEPSRDVILQENREPSRHSVTAQENTVPAMHVSNIQANTVPSIHVSNIQENIEPSRYATAQDYIEPSRPVILKEHHGPPPRYASVQEKAAEPSRCAILHEQIKEPSRYVALHENKENSRSVISQENPNSVVPLPQTHQRTTEKPMSGFMYAAADTGMYEYTVTLGPHAANQRHITSQRQQEIHPPHSEMVYNNQTQIHPPHSEMVYSNRTPIHPPHSEMAYNNQIQIHPAVIERTSGNLQNRTSYSQTQLHSTTMERMPAYLQNEPSFTEPQVHSTTLERMSANLQNQASYIQPGLKLEPAAVQPQPNKAMDVMASKKTKEHSLHKRHPPPTPLNIMHPGHTRSHEESGPSVSSSSKLHDYKIPEGTLPERIPQVEPPRRAPQVPPLNTGLNALSGGLLGAAIQQLQGPPDFNSKHYKPRSSHAGNFEDHQSDDASVASQPTEHAYPPNWPGSMSARDTRNTEYGHPYHDYMGSANWNRPDSVEDKGFPRASHIQGSHYPQNLPPWSYPEHHFYPADQYSHYTHRWPQHPHSARYPGYYKEPPQWARPNSQCTSPLQPPEPCIKGHPPHIQCQCNSLLHSCPTFPHHPPYPPHSSVMHPEEKQMPPYDYPMYKEQLYNSAPYHSRPPFSYHSHTHYDQNYPELLTNRTSPFPQPQPANFDGQSLKGKSKKLLWLSEEEAEIIRLVRMSQDLCRNSSSYGPSGQTSPISSGRAGPSAHSNDARDASRPSSRISTSSLEDFSAKTPGHAGTCGKVPSGDGHNFPVNEEDALKCKVSSEEEHHFPVNDEDTNSSVPTSEEQIFTVNEEGTPCTLPSIEENNYPVNEEDTSPSIEENNKEQDKFQRELVIRQIRAASCIQHHWRIYAERKAMELEKQKRLEAMNFVTEMPPCHEALMQMASMAIRDGHLVIWYDSVLKAAKSIQFSWRETIKRRYEPDQLPHDIKDMYALTVRRHKRIGRTPPSYETFERLMARFRAVTDGARIRRRIGSRRLQIIIKEIREIRLVVDDLSQEAAAGTSCPNLLPQLQSQLQSKMAQLVTALNGPQDTARVLLRRGPATPILVNGSKNVQQGAADSEFANVGDVAHVNVRSSIEIPVRPKMKVRKPIKAPRPTSPTEDENEQPPAQPERSSLPPRSTRKVRRQSIKQQNKDSSENPDASQTMVVSTYDFEKNPSGGKEKHSSKPNVVQSRRRLSTESRKAEQAENSTEQKYNNDESDNDHDTSDNIDVQKRPFLKRKSKAMPAQKLDWSQVKPMVSSRLEPDLKTRLVKPKFKSGSTLLRKKKNFSDVKSRLFSYEKNQSSAGECPDTIQDTQLRNGGSINSGSVNIGNRNETANKTSNAKKKNVKKPSVRYPAKEEAAEVIEQTDSQQNSAGQRKTKEKTESTKQTKISDTEQPLEVPTVDTSYNDCETKLRNHSNRYDDVDDTSHDLNASHEYLDASNDLDESNDLEPSNELDRSNDLDASNDLDDSNDVESSNELDPSIKMDQPNEMDISKELPPNSEVGASECPDSKQTESKKTLNPVGLTSELEKMYDNVITRKQGKASQLVSFFRPIKDSIVPRLQVSSSIFSVPRHDMGKLHQILSKEGCAGRLQHNCLSFVSIRD